MRIQKHAGRIAAVIASLATMAALSGHAQVTGSIWENDSHAGDSNGADEKPSGTPDITFTSSQIFYGTPDDSTINGFLNYSGTTSTLNTGAGNGGDAADNLFVEVQSQVFLTTGLNTLQVGHDDGVSISIAGLGNVL